jgi:SPX domain protein involved in polyphosphate accumulation
MLVWVIDERSSARGVGFFDCSSLNMVAFAKILKKYDKVTKRNLAPMYIKEVECSYFASSDKVRHVQVFHEKDEQFDQGF